MRLTRTFPAEPQSVGSARRFAAGLVTEGSEELRETIELMVSELATNCVRHVNASFEVSIERNGDSYHVEVRDEGGGRPAMRSPSPEDVSGRGLRIVDLLAARWGVRYDADAGKTVWFTLTAPRSAETGEVVAHQMPPRRRGLGAAPAKRSRADVL
jgi:anti-sigma regulatory factor (Ser/Thr protein kinase)